MKRIFKFGLYTVIFVMALVLISCTDKGISTDLWDNAIYTEDTELGDGEKTITVEVAANDKYINFVINTNKNTLGDALMEHNLISGEKGAYGLYVKAVNGITADYDIDQSYWLFTKDGEQMMTGVDGTEISDGECYEITYTK